MLPIRTDPPTAKNVVITPTLYQSHLRQLPMRNIEHLRIAVATNKGTRYLKLSEVASVQAMAPYCYLYLVNGQRLFSNQSIRHYAEKLQETGFVRIHKSWLINVRAVTLYDNEGHGEVTLVNEQRISFSRGKKRKFLAVMKGVCV